MLPAALLAAPVIAIAASQGAVPTPATSSAGASAKPGVTAPLPSFSKADANGDGSVEWQEAKALNVPHKLFKREDVRHDGKLTLTEWRVVRVAMVRTTGLPAAPTKTLPRVPQTVAKAMSAVTANQVASTPSPVTMMKGQNGG